MGKLYNGSTPINKAYLGTSTVQKIYCGSTLIYPMYSTYTLTFSAATGNLTVTCRRTSSPQAGASIGNITSGSNIYTDDVLEFSAVASSGYYVYNTTQVTSSYSEQVTVSSDVVKSYKAVSRNTLTINTTSTAFATEGKYLWSQTFNSLSNVEATSGNPYYPYMNAGLINGRISSATSSSVTCGGWVSSARQKIRGTAYYYSYPSISVSEPRIDDFVPNPFEVTLGNDNSFTVTLQVQGYWESETGRAEINSWTNIDTIVANGYVTIYPSDMTQADDDAEMYEISLQFRFAYTIGGTTYYSEITYVDL